MAEFKIETTQFIEKPYYQARCYHCHKDVDCAVLLESSEWDMSYCEDCIYGAMQALSEHRLNTIRPEKTKEMIPCYSCKKPVWKMITVIRASPLNEGAEYWCQDCWSKERLNLD